MHHGSYIINSFGSICSKLNTSESINKTFIIPCIYSEAGYAANAFQANYYTHWFTGLLVCNHVALHSLSCIMHLIAHLFQLCRVLIRSKVRPFGHTVITQCSICWWKQRAAEGQITLSVNSKVVLHGFSTHVVVLTLTHSSVEKSQGSFWSFPAGYSELPFYVGWVMKTCEKIENSL